MVVGWRSGSVRQLCKVWRRLGQSGARPQAGRKLLSTDKSSLREELADCHLLSHHYGFDELVWNHISARVREGSNEFLVTNGTEHFEEVTAESLVLSSAANANVTADVIHSALYRARPDVHAIVHHHTSAVAAIGVMASGLEFLTQDSAAYVGKVGYHPWEGVSDDYDECARLAASLGHNHTLIMRNHGAITVGRTLAEAWVRYFYLDRCAKVQVLCCGGGNLVRPDPKALQHAARQYDASYPGNFHQVHGAAEWPALRRLAARLRANGLPIPVRPT